MNKKDFKEYFQNDYQKDMETYRKYYYSNQEVERPSICRHHVDYILKNDKIKDYKNFKNFLICNYELNLIIQIVHAHFNDKFLDLCKILPDFIHIKTLRGSGCSIDSPAYLLLSFTQFSKGKMKFDKNLILQADIFFKNYLIKIFNSYPQLGITWELLENAMLHDKDKEREIKYLNQCIV